MSALIRRLRRRSRMGRACCTRCGYARTAALVYGDPILCAVCDARERGVSDIEHHHIAGRANAPDTVAIDANTHRELTAMQHAWPVQTLRNPQGRRELRYAAILRGAADVAVWLAERLESEEDPSHGTESP